MSPQWFRHSICFLHESECDRLVEAAGLLAEWVAGRIPGADVQWVGVVSEETDGGATLTRVTIRGRGVVLEEMVEPDPEEASRHRKRILSSLLAKKLEVGA